MKKPFFAILFAVSIVLGLQNCKDKENINPCNNYKGANADFSITSGVSINYTIVNNDSAYIEFDTVYSSSRSVRFAVRDINIDSCWWKVGQDPRLFTKKSFSLDFTDTGEYKVRLVVLKKNHNNCNGKILDTLEKSFWILPPQMNPIYGKYKGSIEDEPTNEFTIELKDYNTTEHWIAIYNLPPNCDTSRQYMDAFTISELKGRFYFQGNNKDLIFDCDIMRNLQKQNSGSLQPSYTPHGYFNDKTGEINIVWWQRTKIENGQALQRRRVFKGKKI